MLKRRAKPSFLLSRSETESPLLKRNSDPMPAGRILSLPLATYGLKMAAGIEYVWFA